MTAPFVVVIAGPNGSGKTTLTDELRRRGTDLGAYINPDDIALGLTGDDRSRARRAQDLAEEQRQACIGARESFTFETVMSHASKIELMRQAKAAGFDVRLFFVGVENAEINIARVVARTRRGGHGVPHEKVVTRYGRTMALLPDAVRVAHRSTIFDNSYPLTAAATDDRRPLRVVVEIANDSGTPRVSHLSRTVPEWVRAHLLAPLASSS